MTPTGEMDGYKFDVSGLFDGLFIMRDRETQSLWNHMTGESVYGEHAGDTLPVSNLLHMNVTQALEMDPEMLVAMSDRPYNLGSDRPARWTPGDTEAELMDIFIVTLGEEDNRRPRMDMGLGIWTEETQRYYPVDVLRQNGYHKIDDIDGRDVLIILEPLTSTPLAFYWDTNSVTRDGRDLVLDDGYKITNSQLFDAAGNRISVEQPNQIFTRWYGFSLTFPETQVVN